MSSYAVAQINRLARQLVSIRAHPHLDVHRVRGRRMEEWIKLVAAAADALLASTGGRYSRLDFARKTITRRAVEGAR